MDTQAMFLPPLAGESGLSWVLRLADFNLLHGPRPLLRISGLKGGTVSHTEVNLERLAMACGGDPALLTPYSWKLSALTVDFHGHLLSLRNLRNGWARVCPHCIRDLGFARSAWDVRLITACVVHRVQLISSCDRCNSSLSWLRPRLGRCKCGQDLTEVATTSAPSNEIAVSALLECAFAKTKAPWDASGLGPPPLIVTDLMQRSMHEVRDSLRWFEALSGERIPTAPTAHVESIVNHAGPILTGWPKALYSGMDACVERQYSSRPRRASERLSQPVKFVLHMRRDARRIAAFHGHGDDCLIADEVGRYLTMRHEDALVDDRVVQAMSAAGLQFKWISVTAAARQLKIDWRTLRRLIDDGLLECRTQALEGGGTRYYVRVDQLKPELGAMRVLKLAEVSRTLGFPLSAIRELRMTGEFTQSNVGARALSISEHDVELFRQRWASLPVGKAPKGIETMSLHDAHRNPMFGFKIGWKAEIVRRILRGEVPLYGIKAQPVLDAIVAVDDLNNVKGEHEQQRMTIGSVGRALGLGKIQVLQLVVDDHLPAVLSETQVLFEPVDIVKFRQTYIRMRKIAGSSTRAGAMVEVCEQRKIPFIRLSSRSSPVVFVQRIHVAVLQRLVGTKFECEEFEGPLGKRPFVPRKKGGRPKRKRD